MKTPLRAATSPTKGCGCSRPSIPWYGTGGRFEMLWDWAYRFEAYVPAPKRTMGHYALPVLWGERMVGWANLRLERGQLRHELGFAAARPRDAGFQRALDEELARFERFLTPTGS